MNDEPRSWPKPKKWPDSNLEGQGKIIVAILHRLLRSGIVKSEIGKDDFAEDFKTAGYPDLNSFDANGVFSDIMAWLADEGVIRIGNSIDDGDGGSFFIDVVLTAHGLNLLQTKTDVLNGRSPAEVMSTRSTDPNASASQLVKLGGLIGGIIGGITKSIS